MVIKVERGSPTPEELAAIVALVQARAAARETGPEGPSGPTGWADPARNLRRPVPPPGRGAWRMSAWPA